MAVKAAVVEAVQRRVSLIFQAAKWNHVHAIVPAVGNFTDADEHHQEGGLLHLGGVNFTLELLKRICALVNEIVTAYLDLHKTIFPVTQMDNSIAFKVCHVAIMGNLPHQSIGISSQVPDSKRFLRQK